MKGREPRQENRPRITGIKGMLHNFCKTNQGKTSIKQYMKPQAESLNTNDSDSVEIKSSERCNVQDIARTAKEINNNQDDYECNSNSTVTDHVTTHLSSFGEFTNDAIQNSGYSKDQGAGIPENESPMIGPILNICCNNEKPPSMCDSFERHLLVESNDHHDDDGEILEITSFSSSAPKHSWQECIHGVAAQQSSNEVDVDILIAMGFSREECFEAFVEAENNRELAANILLDRQELPK
jgi:hypothetical protein